MIISKKIKKLINSRLKQNIFSKGSKKIVRIKFKILIYWSIDLYKLANHIHYRRHARGTKGHALVKGMPLWACLKNFSCSQPYP